MNHPRSSAAVWALLLAGLATVVVAGKQRPAPVFVPEPEAVEQGIVQGETWTFDGGEYTVVLRRLDDPGRLAHIHERTGIAMDPFAPRPDRPGPYPTFLVEVHNFGAGALSVQPLNCWLVAGVVPDYPLDVPTIESSYAVLEQPMPPAYRNLERVLLDGETVIPAGGRAGGLLIYRPLKPRVKRFRVEVQVTAPNGAVHRFAAGYRRAKKSKK